MFFRNNVVLFDGIIVTWDIDTVYFELKYGENGVFESFPSNKIAWDYVLK